MSARAGRGLLRVGATIVAIVTLCALLGPALAPYDPTYASDRVSLPPPPLAAWPGLLQETWTGARTEPVHWFGTDSAGLDVFSRTVVAARTDLAVAISATAVSLGLGVLLGLWAGYSSSRGSRWMLRGADLVQSFPVFITAMILVALAGRTTGNLVLAMALLYTPIFVRLTRTEVAGHRGRGYVEAARVLGSPEWRTALVHVLPNSLGPALIQSSVTIGFAILLTAGLSFVGAGVRPPTPEWGLMIANGASQVVLGEWWPTVFPGLAISLTVFGFAALGGALEQRDGR
jgi:peptide/nickel transport system permease protein